ncbi:MAG TPA: EamA/RhaT family transporter, partial [Candidatus Methanofastidiosa archaeon]|nr:EamA/RhaT family transporter [Candidatus Methanofastidiosa archaeon]
MKRAHLILFAGVFIASASSILIRMSDAHPLMVATYRMGFASLIMLPMALRGGLVRKLRALSPPKRYLIVLSGIALGLHFATWTSSL